METSNRVYENVVKNRLQVDDVPIHGWYRFVLGYPPHLVREYLDVFGADPDDDVVYDPFCGTATTPVEARLRGFAAVSTDSNPISVLATRTKLTWDIDTVRVRSSLGDVLELASACMRKVGLRANPEPKSGQLDLFGMNGKPVLTCAAIETAACEFDPNALIPPQTAKLIPRGFISQKPLWRVLAVRYAIERLVAEDDIRDLMLLALANTIVSSAGNIGFGPEIYRTAPREDADVLRQFGQTVEHMVMDLKKALAHLPEEFPSAHVFQDDARELSSLDGCRRIGIVITSPPYPNEKDYTRSTRLENVLLGFLKDRKDLRRLKSTLLRSNTRNVFANDDDDRFIADIPSIMRVADEIEQKRVALGKTSGFERQYHRVTRLYFGGMYRHFAALRSKLKPGARCAYVVGDQASFFRVPIRTAQLLADVAIKAGYHVDGIALWRTRRSTVTREDLAENVLLLRNVG